MSNVLSKIQEDLARDNELTKVVMDKVVGKTIDHIERETNDQIAIHFTDETFVLVYINLGERLDMDG